MDGLAIDVSYDHKASQLSVEPGGAKVLQHNSFTTRKLRKQLDMCVGASGLVARAVLSEGIAYPPALPPIWALALAFPIGLTTFGIALGLAALLRRHLGGGGCLS